ncbi:hypothetical protein EEB14_38500 [Rhodococcus sp. WS4]|nr:hypothetical protein EEB14_38500 [Rhodococcus sp. WS4]
MNAATSINYVWWVAAGGAAGALLHYLAVAVVGPRVGVRRTVLALTMCACVLLGIVAASGRDGDGYALVGIGFLGALAPFTALAGQVLGSEGEQSSRRTALLAGWILVAGASMAILGYILADIGSIAFEKIPTRLP